MANESIIEACKKVLVDEFGGDGDIAKKMLIEIFQKVEEVGNSLSEDLSDSEMLERIYVKLGAEPEKARFIINKAFPLERGKPIEYYFRMGIHLSAEYDEANAH